MYFTFEVIGSHLNARITNAFEEDEGDEDRQDMYSFDNLSIDQFRFIENEGHVLTSMRMISRSDRSKHLFGVV